MAEPRQRTVLIVAYAFHAAVALCRTLDDGHTRFLFARDAESAVWRAIGGGVDAVAISDEVPNRNVLVERLRHRPGIVWLEPGHAA